MFEAPAARKKVGQKSFRVDLELMVWGDRKWGPMLKSNFFS